MKTLTLILVLSLGFLLQDCMDCKASDGDSDWSSEMATLSHKIHQSLAKNRKTPSKTGLSPRVHYFGKSFDANPEKILKIVSKNEDGEYKRENKTGSHPVISLDDIHYKIETEDKPLRPGYEYAAYLFQKMLVGGGISPSFLLALELSREEKVFIQASKTIVGETFQSVFSDFSSAEKPRKLNHESLSKLMFSSFLLCPTDGKADNYIINNENEIYAIDNDLSFFSDLSLNEEEGFSEEENPFIYFSVRVRHLFFMFKDIMSQSGHATPSCQKIKDMSPDLLIFEWLAELNNFNKKCEDLPGKFFSPGDKDNLSLPISYPLRDMNTLLMRLHHLKQLVSFYSDSSFSFFYDAINPVVSTIYKKCAPKRKITGSKADLSRSFLEFYSYMIEVKPYFQDEEYFSNGMTYKETDEMLKSYYQIEKYQEQLLPLALARSVFPCPSLLFEKMKQHENFCENLKFFRDLLNFRETPFSFLSLSPKTLKNNQDVFSVYFEKIKNDSLKRFLEKNNSLEKFLPILKLNHYASIFTRVLTGGCAQRTVLKENNDLYVEKPHDPFDRLKNKLKKNKEYNFWRRLDPQSTSELLITSMIINPLNDDPDHFLLIKDSDKPDSYHLVRDCSGLFLGPTCDRSGEIIRKNGDKNIKNSPSVFSFLFCLPQMKDPIHIDAISKILSRRTDLPSEKPASLADFVEKSTPLSTMIPEKVQNRIKDRLFRLEEFVNTYMIEESFPTHWDLFSYLKPELIQLYHDEDNSHPVEKFRGDLHPGVAFSRGMIERFISEDHQRPRDENKALDDFINTPEYLRSKIIQEFDPEKHDKQFELDFLASLKSLKNRSLIFNNFKYINDSHLTSLSFKTLTTLHLNDCPSITSCIFDSLQEMPLFDLSIMKAPNIMYFGYQSYIGNPKVLNFSLLKFLVLHNLKKIKDINFVAPKLIRMSLDEKILNLNKSLESLKKINIPITGNEENIHNFFKPKPISFAHEMPNLKRANLRGIYIDTADQFKELCEDFLANKNLRIIDLSNSNLCSSHVAPFMEILYPRGYDNKKKSCLPCPELEKVDLRYNRIGPKWGYTLIESYKKRLKAKNNKLLSLLLEFNEIGSQKDKELKCLNNKSAMDRFIRCHDHKERREILHQLEVSQFVKEYLTSSEKSSSLFLSCYTMNYLDFHTLDLFLNSERRKKTLETLDLGKTFSLDETFPYIISIIKSQPNLRRLYLNDTILNKSDFDKVLSTIQTFSKLETLSLARSFPYENDFSAFCDKILKIPSLTYLNLSGNKIGTQFKDIFEKISAHKTLKIIDLRGNKITDKGAYYLKKKIVSRNISDAFQTLFLDKNPFSTKAKRILYPHLIDLILEKSLQKENPDILFNLKYFQVKNDIISFLEMFFNSRDRSVFSPYLENGNFFTEYALGASLNLSPDVQALKGDYKCISKENIPGFFRAAGSVNFIQDLSFRDCSLGDEEALIIGEFLKRNKKLKYLNLQNNKIGSKGLKKIFSSIESHSDFEEILINQKNSTLSTDLSKEIKSIMTSSPNLYLFDFDKSILSADDFEKINDIIFAHKKEFISGIIKELESNQLFCDPKDIIFLLHRLGITPSKIAEIFKICQPHVSLLLSNDKSPKSLPKAGTGLLQLTPKDLEKHIEKENFFIQRYSIPPKKYRLIKDLKGILVLLLGQPVQNPYYGLEKGFIDFYDRHSFILESEHKISCLETEDDIQDLILRTDSKDIFNFSNFWNFYFQTDFSILKDLISFFEENISDESLKDESLSCLSMLYNKGIGSTKFYKKVLSLYKEVGGERKGEAFYILSKLYDKNPKKWLSYLEKASQEGHTKANYELGLHYKEVGESQKAFEYFKKASDNYHVMATYHLGTLYEETFFDLNRAFKLYKRSANQFSTHGLLALKKCYENGVGCKIDLEQSAKIEKIMNIVSDKED